MLPARRAAARSAPETSLAMPTTLGRLSANAFAANGWKVTVLTADREIWLRYTGADLSLELHTGTERKDLLERVLGHRIDLVAG